MKKWIKIVIWVLVAALVVTILVFANKEEQNKKYTKPDISIHVDGDAFLTEPELIDRLDFHGLIEQQQAIGKLNIRKIEYVISHMPEVKHVKVFKR
ncbi:MAG: hypothetical protein RJB36_1185, partial [Bacteroidota bacterium]